MVTIPFVIDENVPLPVAVYLRRRGHDVQFVRELLTFGAPDAQVATISEAIGATIVTLDRDFRGIVQRAPIGTRRSFTRLGRLSLRCREGRTATRVQEFIEEIEFEHERAQTRGDRRVIIEITESTFIIVR